MELEGLSALEPRLRSPLSCVNEELKERQWHTAEPEIMAGSCEDTVETSWNAEYKGGCENEEEVDDEEVGRRLSEMDQQVLERKNKIEVMGVEEDGKSGDLSESEPGYEEYTDSENEVELQLKPTFIHAYEVKQPQTLLKSDSNCSDNLCSFLPPIKLLLRQISKPQCVVPNIHSSDGSMGRSECQKNGVAEEKMANQEIQRKGALICPQAETEAVKVKHGGNFVPGPFDFVDQISNLTQCDKSLMKRQNLSEERIGKGSPLCEKLREKIVEQFKNNVPQRKIAKNLGIALSTVHNIIKRFRESGQISVRKGQGRKPLLTGCDIQALRQHCMENKLDSVVEITAWAQKHFGKTLSVNTIRRCIHRC